MKKTKLHKQIKSLKSFQQKKIKEKENLKTKFINLVDNLIKTLANTPKKFILPIYLEKVR